MLELGHHLAQLLAALDDRLGAVRGGERLDVVERRLRAPRAVAVVVGGEVVGDPDQPGPQRPAVGLAPGALEVPVGLQEGLLGEVLGVVVVADPVVGVGVDVAQVGPVEILEGAVELRLRGRSEAEPAPPSGNRRSAWSVSRSSRPASYARAGLTASGGPPRALGPAQAGDPVLGVDLARDQRREPSRPRRLEPGRRRPPRPAAAPSRGPRRPGRSARDLVGRRARAEQLAGAAVAAPAGPSSSRSGRRPRRGRRRSRARPRAPIA